MAETLLHESVYAKFRFDHANNGTTEAEFKANFLKYVNEKYGILAGASLQLVPKSKTATALSCFSFW